MRCVLLCVLSCGVFAYAGPAEQKAIDYLVREVPAWERDNGCFSCHNNGDGARALFAARRAGYRVPDAALSATIEWLRKPLQWDQAAKHPQASDTKLARLQFTVALADARLLGSDVTSVLRDQSAEGAWRVDTGAMPGSPITWGTFLATALVVRALDGTGLAEPVRLARGWLSSAKPDSLLDRAAQLLSLPAEDPASAVALSDILSAQTAGGGWGPQKFAPAEVFDTAVILIALQRLPAGKRPEKAISAGRSFLLKEQLDDGSWVETTRPPGARSYAHQVSTSAWATLALLATDAER